MEQKAPLPRRGGTLTRWLNPDLESSWAVLWANAIGWAVLLVLWICYLALADVESYRRFLYPLLSLVAVFEICYVAALMLKKKRSRTES